MRLTKEESEIGITVTLNDENNRIIINYMGNGDLYWSLYSNNVEENNSFIITKENYELFLLFERLYNDIENINLLDENIDKDRYRKYNISNYNELFDDKNKTITWYSDETAHEVANILKIKKEEETYKIMFYIQPYIEGYDKDFNSKHYIPIRFRNSGSSYEPFNMIFMRMYKKLYNIDDVNDENHQLAIDEYIYKVKKLSK